MCLTASCLATAGNGRGGATPGMPAGPVVRYEMEPMKIEARQGPAGLEIESFDATELFERAGKALSEGRPADAIPLYTKLLDAFPASELWRAALYNRGLAFREEKDWAAAIGSFGQLAEKYAEHGDAKDALFQVGACLAEQSNWAGSRDTFVRILERKDLTADDRIEALARRGFAEFNLGDLDSADKTFRSALAYHKGIENEERLATDFYLAFSQYHLGQIAHRRFREVELRLPESQMDRDLDEKARLLLAAQRSYIETIKFGNPGWASAAGFHVGALYEELHEAFMRAPVPPALVGEARDVYLEEVQKKIRVLLEKSLRWQRENLLMIERLGVNTDWAAKSKLAYSKLMKLLEPGASLSPSSKPAEGAGETRQPPPAIPAAPRTDPVRAPSVPDSPEGGDTSPPRRVL